MADFATRYPRTNYLLTQSWPARAVQGLLDAAMLPGDVASGKASMDNPADRERAYNFAMNLGLLGAPIARPANSIGMGGKVPQNAPSEQLRFFHGGPGYVPNPRATVDPEGLPMGFSVSNRPEIAGFYASGGGRAGKHQGVVSEYVVDKNAFKPIGEMELYDLQKRLETEMDLDEGDLPDEVLLETLKNMGVNAIQYSTPEFGTRIIDPSILKFMGNRT